MDPTEDKDLLWIAKEGLKAPLPEPWKPCKTAKQEIYYFNFQTGESIWEHPCDQHYKQIYQEEKTKKAKRSGKDAKAKPDNPAGKPSAKAAAAVIPDTRQSEKLKAEIDVFMDHF